MDGGGALQQGIRRDGPERIRRTASAAADASGGGTRESTAVKPGESAALFHSVPRAAQDGPGRPVDKSASAPPPPPAAPKPEPPAVPREPAPDPRAADAAAVRETLRRYSQAYQSLDAAAVGRMMPSLTDDQLRDLGRDLSSYRRYTVEIKEERIEVNGPTATVTCQVVRSFETKNGVAGSNTVPSHLSSPPERAGMDDRPAGVALTRLRTRSRR